MDWTETLIIEVLRMITQSTYANLGPYSNLRLVYLVLGNSHATGRTIVTFLSKTYFIKEGGCYVI